MMLPLDENTRSTESEVAKSEASWTIVSEESFKKRELLLRSVDNVSAGRQNVAGLLFCFPQEVFYYVLIRVRSRSTHAGERDTEKMKINSLR